MADGGVVEVLSPKVSSLMDCSGARVWAMPGREDLGDRLGL